MPRSAELSQVLQEHGSWFQPVVPFDPLQDKLVPVDLSIGNKELAGRVTTSTLVLGPYIDGLRSRHQARYGIGGYDEHRGVYAASRVFDADESGKEPRRLHLGTDIWGKPHTAVMAPCDGIVHSYAFNNHPGDYGVTIILSHQLSGHTFYTLFGHLSLNSIKNIYEGQRVEAGETFAEFGIPMENGQWPPHLHFQLVLDIGDWKGDYPGVCALSEREKYLGNCPDPDVILKLNQYRVKPPG